MKNLKHYLLYSIILAIWTFIILFLISLKSTFSYDSNKDFIYANDKEFIESVNRCADYLEKTLKKEYLIPRKLLLAQAALESNYGKSRYAIEGNNLMGIYQFKNLHTGMVPRNNPKAPFRVAKFKSKCHSIEYYMEMLNSKNFYKSFRDERLLQSKTQVKDESKYFYLMYNYSTNPKYPQLLIKVNKEIENLGF